LSFLPNRGKYSACKAHIYTAITPIRITLPDCCPHPPPAEIPHGSCRYRARLCRGRQKPGRVKDYAHVFKELGLGEITANVPRLYVLATTVSIHIYAQLSSGGTRWLFCLSLKRARISQPWQRWSARRELTFDQWDASDWALAARSGASRTGGVASRLSNTGAREYTHQRSLDSDLDTSIAERYKYISITEG